MTGKLAELQAKWDVKKLQLESARAQLKRHRDLSAQGLLSQEALQQSELAEAQAAVELRQLEAERAGAHERPRAPSSRASRWRPRSSAASATRRGGSCSWPPPAPTARA